MLTSLSSEEKNLIFPVEKKFQRCMSTLLAKRKKRGHYFSKLMVISKNDGAMKNLVTSKNYYSIFLHVSSGWLSLSTSSSFVSVFSVCRCLLPCTVSATWGRGRWACPGLLRLATRWASPFHWEATILSPTSGVNKLISPPDTKRLAIGSMKICIYFKSVSHMNKENTRDITKIRGGDLKKTSHRGEYVIKNDEIYLC